MDNTLTNKKRKRIPPRRFHDEVYPSYKRPPKQVTWMNPIHETIPDPIYNPINFIPCIIIIYFMIYFQCWFAVLLPIAATIIVNRLNYMNSKVDHDDGGIEFVENITADDRQRIAEEKGEVINVD